MSQHSEDDPRGDGRAASDLPWTDQASSFGEQITARIAELAAVSDAPDSISRVYLSRQHRAARDMLMDWMREAGMASHLDAVGNVCGRYEGREPGVPCLMLGSHYDTVRDAGRWDGPLGIVTAIACVASLNARGVRFPFAIEIVAFADEEGVRFSSTLLGSRAVAGTFDKSVLNERDRDGITMRDAMVEFGLDPLFIGRAARAPREILAYIELHIEQGPVLEREKVPVGVVTSIAGATRLAVRLRGMAGHAGTVPMELRRDALTGAAECILAIETFCRTDAGLVGTVGYLDAAPGVTNVIPGTVSFTIDMRSGSDLQRNRSVAEIVRQIERISSARRLDLQIDITHENRSAPCASWLQQQIAVAIDAEGHQVFSLPSGAGHDGMALVDLADIGMIFVRCRGGISHHPDEHVDVADVNAGARVLLRVIERFEPRGSAVLN